MIDIKVDEAYAFDMLAVLAIKASKSDVDLENYANFLENIRKELHSQGNIVDAVLKSDEYAAMIDANQKVFKLIDEVAADARHPNDRIDAITVHTANMKRFYAKQALQEKFFSEGLTERKTVR